MTWQIDSRLAPFIIVAEVERGDRFVHALFSRKFGHAPPDYGHHLVAFYRRADGSFVPVAYLHLLVQGAIGLVGGGCTDGDVVRSMSEDERRMIAESGGLLLQMLRFCFAKFEQGLEAFFGTCGNARAREVDLKAGWVDTGITHLMTRPNRPLDPKRYEELLAQAEALGLF
jgi:hypothetical protein